MITEAKTVAELRMLVGFLGEQQPVWWTSQFFSPSASAFLNPVFARSMPLAQYQGVTAAAARLHDEFIGIGGRTFHLFRLPEIYEQSAASALTDQVFVDQLRPCTTSKDEALARLAQLANASTANEGPQIVGDLDDDLPQALKTMAGLYLDAFRKGIKTFPFLREAQ